MQANELRELYLSFYKERRHEIATAASLVPEDDASVLYTTAGMQPLIPYLLGKKHPKGDRLVNVQRCVRTGDIEEVGDDIHLARGLNPSSPTVPGTERFYRTKVNSVPAVFYTASFFNKR